LSFNAISLLKHLGGRHVKDHLLRVTGRREGEQKKQHDQRAGSIKAVTTALPCDVEDSSRVGRFSALRFGGRREPSGLCFQQVKTVCAQY
jgi:hypothetical protein